MNYRRLGSSGLKVSEISLGTWMTVGEQLDERASHALLDTGWDAGMNTFDTADIYQNGRAEEFLGTWVKTKPREEVVIGTKCLRRMWGGPNGDGLSKKHILVAAEHSLRRLGTDYIDIYYFHWPDPETPIQESLEAMDMLVRQGKVLYPAFSNYDIEDLCQALETIRSLSMSPFSANQLRYGLFTRDIERALMRLCAGSGLGVVAWSPLEQGLISEANLSGEASPGSRLYGRDRTEAGLTTANLTALGALTALAHGMGATLCQLALAWILAHPEISSCIVGAATPEEVREDAGSTGVVLSPEELDRVDSILQARDRALATGDVI